MYVAVTHENLFGLSQPFDLGLHLECWGDNVSGLGEPVVLPEEVQASEANDDAENTKRFNTSPGEIKGLLLQTFFPAFHLFFSNSKIFNFKQAVVMNMQPNETV